MGDIGRLWAGLGRYLGQGDTVYGKTVLASLSLDSAANPCVVEILLGHMLGYDAVEVRRLRKPWTVTGSSLAWADIENKTLGLPDAVGYLRGMLEEAFMEPEARPDRVEVVDAYFGRGKKGLYLYIETVPPSGSDHAPGIVGMEVVPVAPSGKGAR